MAIVADWRERDKAFAASIDMTVDEIRALPKDQRDGINKQYADWVEATRMPIGRA